MANAPNTRPTDAVVPAFLAGLEPARRRTDAQAIAALPETVAGCPSVLRGTGIIGPGQYPGKTGAWPRPGLTPRKGHSVVHPMGGLGGRAVRLANPGRARAGVSCRCIPELPAIDTAVLAEMARRSWAMMARQWPLPGCKVPRHPRLDQGQQQGLQTLDALVFRQPVLRQHPSHPSAGRGGVPLASTPAEPPISRLYGFVSAEHVIYEPSL